MTTLRPVTFAHSALPKPQQPPAQRRHAGPTPRFGHHSPEHTAIQLWQVVLAGGTSLSVMALYARESIKSAVRKVTGRKAKPHAEPEGGQDE